MLLPALAVALLAAAASTAPAAAAVPSERTIADAVEPGKAYDVVSVTLTAAAAEGKKASVVVRHHRRVDSGDGIDMWFDTDGDRSPDIYLTGYAFSEYAVYKARGFDGHGRDISDRGCVQLRMTGKRSVVRLDPGCLAPSETFSVSVRSFVHDQPRRTVDNVPGPDRLTKRVLSSAG
ncbi:hypothetical protein JCM10369A_28200 [Nocardioides pyridinolyticus]